ncbi:hypothetical protein LCGC14_1595350 [marine sediment metagenome]|uniref:Uncharacterized protein n=1 Tax=marine sediment metagenome TaxID=412755 RepID=A0A0F9ID44_9ZZZZ
MECKISLSDDWVKKCIGNISSEAFAEFCKDAVASELFRAQFKDTQGTKTARKEEVSKCDKSYIS